MCSMRFKRNRLAASEPQMEKLIMLKHRLTIAHESGEKIMIRHVARRAVPEIGFKNVGFSDAEAERALIEGRFS